MAIGFRAIRHEEGATVITARNGKALLREVARLGYNPERLFLKHESPAYSGAFAHSKLKDGSVAPLDEEFRALARMHEALPENAARPVALVKRPMRGVSGYLSEYIEGDRLSSLLFDTVDGRRLTDEEKRNMLMQLIVLICKLASHKAHHGDLQNLTNSIVTNDGRLVVIDPFPGHAAAMRDVATVCGLSQAAFAKGRLDVNSMFSNFPMYVPS